MARWQDVVDSAPEFAARVQGLFDAGRHKTLATLRRDGAPRISGIECEFREGDLWFGSGQGSRKSQDLRRDARMALHGPTVDPGEDPLAWPGEAKVSGRAVPEEGPTFRVEILEVVLTRVGAMDHLLVELWTPARGLTAAKVYN